MLFDVGGIVGSVGAGVISDRFFNGQRFSVALLMSVLMAVALPIFFWMSQIDSGEGPWLSLLVLGICVAGPDNILGAAGAHDICERYGLGVVGLGIATGALAGVEFIKKLSTELNV